MIPGKVPGGLWASLRHTDVSGMSGRLGEVGRDGPQPLARRNLSWQTYSVVNVGY